MSNDSIKKGTDVQVQLIDPNAVNINDNPNFPNGISQYQDMFIFAELTAIRKGRTVITVNSGSKNDNLVVVNFIGNNQNIDVNDPDRLNFTTNYYQGSQNGNEQFESFGMTSIKVTVNSSYVPQVSIQFVDIRGLSFFNQTDSKYRILFDFPPPIFSLTIKGYYGQSLSYDLHLVKYTTEFKAENGNFIIDAQFVGMTFAPLTDVLFRYIVNAPLIGWNVNSSVPNVNKIPINTNDFIIKLKSLYAALNGDKPKTEDYNKLDTVNGQIEANKIAMGELEEYTGRLDGAGLTPYIFTITNGVAKKLSTISDYDAIKLTINSQDMGSDASDNTAQNGINPDLVPKLYVGYIYEQNTSVIALSTLKKYKEGIIHNANTNKGIGEVPSETTDLEGPFIVPATGNISTNPNKLIFTQYVAINITGYYNKLKSARLNFERTEVELSNLINTKINATILGHLGMQPTIHNVFKLLCDDVDTFFRTVRETSKKAENLYANQIYKDIIAKYINSSTNGGSDYTNKIFPFPLVIEQQPAINKIMTEVRTAPIELNRTLTAAGSEMPEMRLVYDFIDSFLNQRKINQIEALKEQQLEDGTFVWIPITPIDSKLGALTPDSNSPYIKLPSSNAIIDVLLDRFYILSQYSIPTKFYAEDWLSWWSQNKTVVSNAYIELYMKSEAMNIIISQTTPKIIQNLRTISDKYSKNIDTFYSDMAARTDINDKYKFDVGKRVSIGDAYLNRSNANYNGLTFYYGNVATYLPTDNSPLGIFAESVQRGKVKEFFFGILPDSSFLFTDQNLLYIIDSYVVDNKTDTTVKGQDEQVTYDNLGSPVQLSTRYLTIEDTIDTIRIGSWDITEPIVHKSYPSAIDYLLNNGNRGFYDISNFSKLILDSNILTTTVALQNFTNVVTVWVDILGRCDTQIVNELFDVTTYDDKLSAIIMLSNFGLTLSPYNWYPKSLNGVLFANPAVIETPYYLAAYIGGLVYAIENNLIGKLKAFFIKHAPKVSITTTTTPYDYDSYDGATLHSGGFYLFADYYDIKTYMSPNDKKLFKTRFVEYLESTHQAMVSNVFDAYTAANIHGEILDVNNPLLWEKERERKRAIYNKRLNPMIDGGSNAVNFNGVFGKFLKHDVNFVVYSENTFKLGTESPFGYTSYISLGTFMDEYNKNSIGRDIWKAKNDKFFQGVFSNLYTLITHADEKRIKEEQELKKLTGDKDIVTQMYYSFKNINDKWLTSPIHDYSTGKGGYPYAPNNSDFIDSFAFVDRTMNDIGDTVINPESIIEAFNDTDVNVYSVMSKLLSLNGFLFFPLQNFMNHTIKSWEDTFKITPNVKFDTMASFICMYIGGSSSYPSSISNGFKNDGMDSVMELAKGGEESKPQPTTTPTDNITGEKIVSEDPNSPWRKVKAFNVKFGQQNQSMFTDMKIDSKEFPETNESIQILARLAGDEKDNAPVQKGQNLYNLYENRAYSATITGLGNAMIQPTQYFQLDNIPLYNGAYLILGVEHNITANKMTTSFNGTKILKFPVPRVIDAAAVMGFGVDVASNAQIAGSNPTTAGVPVDGRANTWNTLPFNGKPTTYKLTFAETKAKVLAVAASNGYTSDLAKAAFILMFTEQGKPYGYRAYGHNYGGVRTIGGWKHATGHVDGMYQVYVDNGKEPAGYYEYLQFISDEDWFAYYLPTLSDRKFTAVSATVFADIYAKNWYGSNNDPKRYNDGYKAGLNGYNAASPIWDKS